MSHSDSLVPTDGQVAYKSICDGKLTWNSKITKDDSPYAALTYRRIKDEGEIELNGTRHAVTHKTMSGEWKMMPGGADDPKSEEAPIARATRKGLFSTGVTFIVGKQTFVGHKPSFMKSGVVFSHAVSAKDKKDKFEAGKQCGFIKCTKHIGTKEYSAVFDEDVPEILPAFSMWYSCLMARRGEEGAAAGAAAGAATAAAV